MREWLPADDPVWLVLSLVDRLDTAALHALRSTGGVGRRGYDPDMLLALLIWGWAHGQRSSRQLERSCQRDVAFRVICGGDGPDHVTIARFRAQASPMMPDLFAQVLAACAGLGLGQLGVVALDGVKIASNASLAKNRSEKHLVKAREDELAMLRSRLAATAANADAEHAVNDAGAPDCDRVPTEVLSSDRLARIDAALADVRGRNAAAGEQSVPIDFGAREAKRAAEVARRAEYVAEWRRQYEAGQANALNAPAELQVELSEEALNRVIAEQQGKVDRHVATGRGRPPLPVDRAKSVRDARERLEQARLRAQARADAADAVAANREQFEATIIAHRAAGTRQHRASADGLGNLTDPQSRPMPLRGGGWVQGFNCQAVTSSDGLIIATGVTRSPADTAMFRPMMDKAVAAASIIESHRPHDSGDGSNGIGVILADAGYHSEDNITAEGPDRLIATSKSHKLPRDTADLPEPGIGASATEKMTYKLATHRSIYAQRSHIAETPFGQAKHNLGFRRFTSRGMERAESEFAFHAMVHNIWKAIRGGHLVTA